MSMKSHPHQRRRANLRGGCAAKLPGSELYDLLDAAFRRVFPAERLPPFVISPQDSAILDAGDTMLLVTTDIGPLVGDDPLVGGRIAAGNAFSDIWARGGAPRWALVTLVLDGAGGHDSGEATLAGVLGACRDEGVEVVGGHTMVGSELLVGLAIIGSVAPGCLLGKTGGTPGARLFLSKPLGAGLVLRAHAVGAASDTALQEAIEVMLKSNAGASRLAVSVRAQAATDVSGFGLLGHLAEMLDERCGAQLRVADVPVLESVHGLRPGVVRASSLQANLDYARDRTVVRGDTDVLAIGSLLGAETNGGLLIAANESDSQLLSSGGYACIGGLTDVPGIVVER